MSSEIKSIEILDDLIIGRVKPSIYAFTTNTIPNYLKIGDTFRPVNIRLNEWKKKYPSLDKKYEAPAVLGEDTYFRDYSIHQFLLKTLRKTRLQKASLLRGVYYSNEFFKDTSVNDMQKAIADIKENFNSNTNKYPFYSVNNKTPTKHHYVRGENWELRPNQKEVVNNFIKAYKNNRTNLLMYAVMRFGKSFTSLYCGLVMDAHLIVIVSAKADVQEEWKKTVESAGNFKEYVYLNSDDLLFDHTKLSDTLADNKVVLFLTLQDLQGKDIKQKHKEIFSNGIDLLIIDETHFGARGQSYGAVIKKNELEKYNLKNLQDEFVLQEDANERIKKLNSKIKIHLSGTPYRILLENEFEKEDIISFIQFTDIVQEKEKWDTKYLVKDEIEEWDNPYFGFPQMIRFAFKLNKSSLNKIADFQNEGTSIGLSHLFKTKSIKKDKDKNSHKDFINKNAILELLKAIDGSESDDSIFPFLDYERIKSRKMCRHIVMVLPYCASCDAMEKLLDNQKESFNHLNYYEIINISGLDAHEIYRKPADIKQKIKNCERENKRTITLTVNRMLTGSTVEEWDTMIFLKDTNSPQEYDQATFRIQNQYIRTLTSRSGIIKENMKPQTLLIDFNPYRMFILQEQKAMFHNINKEKKGNSRLQKRIEEELRISPLVVMDENQIKRVTATDILKQISKYNNNRSISDEVIDIPTDLSLFNNKLIRDTISRQADFNSKLGFTASAYEEYSGNNSENEKSQKNKTNKKNGENPSTLQEDKDNNPNKDEKELQKFEKKFKTYYQRILFYSFLTDTQINSLDEIIQSLGKENNSRILRNLGLEENVLQNIAENMDPFVRSSLDYKIQNISNLAFDESKTPLERALTSLNKFNRLSESEIITSKNICEKMIELIPEKKIKNLFEENKIFLDIASKSAEFAIVVYKKMRNLGFNHEKIQNNIYSIPTSSVAYELTRKFYEILGLNINNIYSKLTSYELLEVKKGKKIDYEKIGNILKQDLAFSNIKLNNNNYTGSDSLKFGAIVGNPPYNVSDGGAQASSKPIYQHFVMLSKQLNPEYSTFVIPTRWFSGGKGLNEFREYMINNVNLAELHDVTTPLDIFPGTNNRGGICYFLIDKHKTSDKVKIFTYKNNNMISSKERKMKIEGLNIFIRDNVGIDIIDKIIRKTNLFFSEHVSSLRPFGFRGFFTKSEDYHKTPEGLTYPVKCYGKGMQEGFVEKKLITKNQEYISTWKVFISRANNIATELNDDNLNTYIGEPDVICTETYLMVGAKLNLNEYSIKNLSKYFKTKFARYMHSLAKSSHDSTAKTFRFVPVENFNNDSDINWDKSVSKIDKQLFNKYGLSEKEIIHVESTIKKMK